MKGFDVVYRDSGHWDICSNGSREFAIRGEPGDVVLRDERKDIPGPFPRLHFKTITAAMAYVVDHYMHEEPKQ